MEYTKKIIGQSNAWYNDGLRKAQIRDMSGAVLSLRRSLQYNRGNIAARNLLGLVLYGRGEVAEALVEWIISKNLRPRDNIANEYIQRIQDSAKELEVINQAVKKYNQSLAYCSQNGEDLAIIQLKQVISAHPAFLKAYQLLALCYIHTEQYAKARDILKEARKLDTTNELTLKYIHELSQARVGKKRKRNRKKTDIIEYRLGNDTIIQPVQKVVKGLGEQIVWVNLLAGLCIGAAVVWFLITPAVDEKKSDERNKQIIEYSEQINSMEAQISALTRTLSGYRAENQNSENEALTAAGTADSYENLMNASAQYNSGSYSEDVIAETLLNVNPSALGASGQETYNEISSAVFPVACEMKYSAGIESLDVANYETAVGLLYQVVCMDESYESGGALLNLGIACLRNGDSASATSYLRRVNELFPDTDYAAQAKENLDAIAQQTAEQSAEGETE